MRILCGRCDQWFDTPAEFAEHNPHTAETPDITMKKIEGQRGGPPSNKGPRVSQITSHPKRNPSAKPMAKPQ